MKRAVQSFALQQQQHWRQSSSRAWHQPVLQRFVQGPFRAASSASSKEIRSATIGFVGLGNMGFPMVKNLAESTVSYRNAGDILVFDTNPAACEHAAMLDGVRVVKNLEELACQSLIVTMLPGDLAVDAVLQTLNNHWVKEQQQQQEQKKVVIDCSTVSPTTSIRWSETMQQMKSGTLFDAPVSGGVKGATDGTLTFMLGGCSALSDQREGDSTTTTADGVAREPALPDVKLILEQMGSRVIECGPNVGAGAVTKLCNNLALASQMIGICEALNLGEKLGVDPIVLSSVLNSSTAACWSCKVNNPHPTVAAAAATTGSPPPAARQYQGGFATNLMLKDLGLALQVASEQHVALPLSSMSKQLYQLSALQGKGMHDFGAVIQVLRGKNDGDDKKQD